MPELLGGEEVVAEFAAEVDVDFGEGAFPVGEEFQVLEAVGPFGGVAVQVEAEVFEEVHPELGAVGKAELLLHDGDLALGGYGFGLFVLLVVEAPFYGGAGVLDQVDSQIFPSAQLHGPGIPDWRVEVKIEGNLSRWQLPFSECYFCGRHSLSVELVENGIHGGFLEIDVGALPDGGDVPGLGEVVDALVGGAVFFLELPGGVVVV